MRNRTIIRYLVAAVLVASVSLPLWAEVPHSRPGPAADRILFRAFDVDRAPRDLEANQMDLYMFSLKTAAAQRLRGNPAFNLYEAPASTVSLLLNPAPAAAGDLNPFSIKEVRQAVQYLVDREFIAREIYRGMARPMITHVSPHDFDYLTVFETARGSGITYDPEYAREMIASAMQNAGATRSGGFWSIGGQPIRVRLVARVEDERRDIGDLLRRELERAGFMVSVSYRPFAAAVMSVYSTDPKSFEWHIYTEGWGRSSPTRYDFSNVNQMNAPWLGNMPGWKEIGFWQYENDELDLLGQRLFRGEFSDRNERDDIYRRMTELGLDESVRVWLATAMNSFPAQNTLTGMTEDITAGPRSPWTLREAHIPGTGDLRVGHLWVWTERTTWNPVGGFGDVYSVDIWRYITDPAVWNHPFTGMPEPVRAEFTVETAGPDGRIAVPSGAVVWNARANRWDPAAGAQATSRVVYDYSKFFQSKWHHGIQISMADVMYALAQSYELAYDTDKARIEVALGVTARPYLETFKGFRILDENRIEVYVDFWHFEEAYIASYATPSGLGMPWEILAAMDDVVFSQRRGAYSDTAASRFNVPWLSLVMDRDARLVQRTLQTFRQSRFVPQGVFQVGDRNLMTADRAVERYQAALKWFTDHGNLVISNGPFYLAAYDPPAQFAELRAFRDPSYPFKPGDWLFGAAPRIAIRPPQTPDIEPGSEVTYTITVDGEGELDLRYVMIDPVDGSVVTSGTASRTASNTFTVRIGADITNTLWPGLYRLHLAATSDRIAQVVEYTADIDVLP
ncbi:MAG: hypothetical protein EA426_13010 [Spirochaetaceae bacterium]|nr:MAG: hypothetical protein EA426_13010 [Spirochaetaceae bacterium]